MGGDQGHLAPVGETAPNLADGEPVAQYDRLLGEVNSCGTGSSGSMDRYLKRAEVLLRPVLALEVLVPGNAGDAAPGQPLEQVRAPALAVEHQGERRRAGLWLGQVGGRFRYHPQLLQVRHHVLLDGLDQLRVERLVQAQQGRAAQSVDPIAHGRWHTQLLARDEVFRQPTVAPGVYFGCRSRIERLEGV